MIILRLKWQTLKVEQVLYARQKHSNYIEVDKLGWALYIQTTYQSPLSHFRSIPNYFISSAPKCTIAFVKCEWEYLRQNGMRRVMKRTGNLVFASSSSYLLTFTLITTYIWNQIKPLLIIF